MQNVIFTGIHVFLYEIHNTIDEHTRMMASQIGSLNNLTCDIWDRLYDRHRTHFILDQYASWM